LPKILTKAPGEDKVLESGSEEGERKGHLAPRNKKLLPSMTKERANTTEKSRRTSISTKLNKLRPRSLPKILISGGYTISQQRILELRELYFRLAGGDENITLASFSKSVGEENDIKKIMVSLFNRLDAKGLGHISFEDLLVSFYPSLKKNRREKMVVNAWLDEILTAEKVFEEKGRKADKVGFVLKVNDTEKVKEAFLNLDVSKKGCRRRCYGRP